MEVELWLQIVSAIIVGSVMAALFVYAAFVSVKLQTRDGLSDEELPLWIYAALIVPLLCVLGGVWTLL